MKCPFCREGFHPQRKPMQVGLGPEGNHKFVTVILCPSCNQVIFYLERIANVTNMMNPNEVIERTLIWPRISSRPPAPSEVPAQYAEDYIEAALVLTDSPKASAALSRRAMQNILRDKEGVKPGNLSAEIKEAISNGNLPSHVEDQLDAVREIGNLAAHPTKDQNTGSVLAVEPGEADWNLDVLEALFDHYFVKPAVAQARKDAINQKLQQAGRRPI